MYTLRCTQQLLTKLGSPSLGPDEVEPTTVLGHWYANTFNVGRLRLLLCTSERTLLTVILPARDLRQFPERLRDATERLLAGLGVPGPQIARERREMTWHQFGRTVSRQVLGTMTDFALLADTHIRNDGPDVDLVRVALMLNRAPCRPIDYESPDRFTRALFPHAS